MSGVRLTIREATKAKRMRTSNGFPDLVIYEPVGEFQALFIELKASGTSIVTKDGRLRKDEHLEEQADMHRRLRAKGYAVCFAVGIDAALKVVDAYMKEKWNRISIPNTYQL
jgi:hypothetical protein